MTKETRHVVLITVDAVNASDFMYLKTLPNFKSLCDGGAYSTRLRTVYPSDTYPVHTTISTGCYPRTHGVGHNKPFAPGVPNAERPWYWYRNEIKASVFYEAAYDAGVSTAVIMWPVTCGAKTNILLAERMALKGENQVCQIVKYASKPFIFTAIAKVLRHIKGTSQPHIDAIMARILKNVLISKKPRLAMIHLFDADSQKHTHGVSSDAVKKALARYDARVGELIAAVKRAGVFEVTTFVIASDHGQCDICFDSHLNNLFAREGLLTEKAGKLVSWRAYSDSCGASAAIHTDGQGETNQKVRAALDAALRRGEFGIGKILGREQMDSLGCGPGPEFFVDAKSGFAFRNSLSEKDITPVANAPRGDHGDLPEKEHNRCIFVACGSGIAHRGEIGQVHMVDIAPTVMQLLGLDFACEGRVLTEILK